MAGYASSTMVTSDFKFTSFTGTTPVTLDEIDEWSEQFSRTLDSYLIKRYQVPLTTADSLSIAALIVRGLVAARVARILNSTVGIGESELNRAISLEKWSDKWIMDFKDGCIELSDAIQKDRLAPKSFNQSNSIEPKWQKDVDQW